MFGSNKEKEPEAFDFYWCPDSHTMYAVREGKDPSGTAYLFPYTASGQLDLVNIRPESEKRALVPHFERIGTFTDAREAATYRAAEFINQFERDGMTPDGILAIQDELQDIPAQALLYYLDFISTDAESNRRYPESMNHANEMIGVWLNDERRGDAKPEKLPELCEQLVSYIAYERDVLFKERHQEILKRHAEKEMPKRTMGRMSIDY